MAGSSGSGRGWDCGAVPITGAARQGGALSAGWTGNGVSAAMTLSMRHVSSMQTSWLPAPELKPKPGPAAIVHTASGVPGLAAGRGAVTAGDEFHRRGVENSGSRRCAGSARPGSSRRPGARRDSPRWRRRSRQPRSPGAWPGRRRAPSSAPPAHGPPRRPSKRRTPPPGRRRATASAAGQAHHINRFAARGPPDRANRRSGWRPLGLCEVIPSRAVSRSGAVVAQGRRGWGGGDNRRRQGGGLIGDRDCGQALGDARQRRQ